MAWWKEARIEAGRLVRTGKMTWGGIKVVAEGWGEAGE